MLTSIVRRPNRRLTGAVLRAISKCVILFSFGAQVQAGEFRWPVKVNGRNVCVITKIVILISAQFNILPHYLFMVQNQITVSLCITIAI